MVGIISWKLFSSFIYATCTSPIPKPWKSRLYSYLGFPWGHEVCLGGKMWSVFILSPRLTGRSCGVAEKTLASEAELGPHCCCPPGCVNLDNLRDVSEPPRYYLWKRESILARRSPWTKWKDLRTHRAWHVTDAWESAHCLVVGLGHRTPSAAQLGSLVLSKSLGCLG